jgi:hypothetical protein
VRYMHGNVKTPGKMSFIHKIAHLSDTNR